MIKRGRHLIKSHMTLNYEFTGIRIMDSELIPVDWKVTVDLVAMGKKGKPKEEAEYEAGIVYQKIYFWLETNLPNIIMVDVNNEDDLYIANLSSNIMLYCPGTTGDDVVIQLLHSKLTALAGDGLIISEMHLKGSDSTLQYTFDSIDGGYQLPLTTLEYYTDGITRDKLPWWTRDDGFCFEFARPDDNEQSDEELFGDIIDPMDEFRNIMAEVSDMHIGMLREPAKIVQVEKWKPRTV